jgi:hypothetical protein
LAFSSSEKITEDLLSKITVQRGIARTNLQLLRDSPIGVVWFQFENSELWKMK